MKIARNNQNRKSILLRQTVALAGAALLGWSLATTGLADGPAVPVNSSACGKSLAQWHETYMRWSYGQWTFPADANGNAVVSGQVVLLPMPSAQGDGTPASVDVTLNVGQPFVLPLWNVLGTSYDDGTPVDSALPISVFKTLEITLTIDGRVVVDSGNVLRYYVAYTYDPEIPLPPEWTPYLSLVWAQGICIVHTPLPPGSHTFQLDVKNTEPVIDAKGGSWTFEYHNTWNVTVKPRGK